MSDSVAPMNCSTPGFCVLHQLPELAQTHAHQVSDAIQPSHSLLPLLLLPSVFPSIRVFSSESALHIKWPNYWSFSTLAWKIPWTEELLGCSPSLDEVYWPCSHSRAMPSFPSQLEWKIGLAWANTRGSLNSPS